MSTDIASAPVVVLRRADQRLVHGVRLLFTDRGGTLLANVDEPIKRPRLWSLDGFGGARNRARRVVVSTPDGVPFLQIDKAWNALRRPASVVGAAGLPLGSVRQISRLPSAPKFEIADPQGTVIGTLAGSLQAMKVTDAGGHLVAEIFKEGEALVQVTRAPVPEPLRSMVLAALVTVRLVIWGARIDLPV